MPITETVKQMQAQGISDTDISQRLQEQGFNPKEIDDAINQSKIKAAVSENYEQNGQEAVISSMEMQPSVISQQPIPQPQVQEYMPQVQEYMPIEQPQPYGTEYYQPPQGISPETITEIAEQIVVEKTSEIKKSLSLIADFKSITDAKLSNLDSRLKKIETIIEKLQASIIGKVGEYGQAISDIKDEIAGMEESFSKVINPLVEKSRKVMKETAEEEISEEIPKETKSRKKSKDGFENYLTR